MMMPHPQSERHALVPTIYLRSAVTRARDWSCPCLVVCPWMQNDSARCARAAGSPKQHLLRCR